MENYLARIFRLVICDLVFDKIWKWNSVVEKEKDYFYIDGRKFNFNIPEPNFTIQTGEPDNCVQLNFCVSKNILNKIKWKFFCFFFPFKITKWTRRKK